MNVNEQARGTDTPELPETVSSSDPSSAGFGDDKTKVQCKMPARFIEPSELLPVPGYSISREIARGGMGVVYVAHDPVFDRPVAIKVMHFGQDAGRFVVESKVTAQLPHPGVPPVYALGELGDGRPFLAMKFIEGRTLAHELKAANRLGDLPRLLGTFDQVCQTVGFAHSRGIVHRDLKPANIMVGAFGEVLLMDWGLARLARRPEPGEAACIAPEAVNETVAGQVKGTPAFMAPEQARGETVDERADVFALGGILAVLLTGEPPFHGDTVLDTVRKAAAGDLGKCFTQLNRCGADPVLIDFARRCLAFDPSERPANGMAVADAIGAYRDGVEKRLQKAQADRAAAEVREIEGRRRRRIQLALAGSLGLLLIAGGAFAWWQDEQVRERNEKAYQQEIEDGKKALIERERTARNGGAVELLLSRAEDGLRADDAPAAALAFREAEGRAKEGGTDNLTDRFARSRLDLALLLELNRIDDLRWAVVNGKMLGLKRAVTKWPDLFRRHGVIPGTTSPTEAARRIHDSLVRDRLLGALDLWFSASRSDQLLAILRAADSDRYRTEVREAIQRGDTKRLRELASQPDAIQQPARFAIVIGQADGIPLTSQREILRTAHQRQPGSLSILMALGGSYPINQLEGAFERIGWYRAALAVRPDNTAVWTNLGLALDNRKDYDEAVFAYREAVRRDPTHATAHYNLGVALNLRGDLDRAVSAFREAVRLDPNDAEAYTNLGVTLADKRDSNGAIAAYREAIRLDPALAFAHYNLGLALHLRGDLDGAITAYREAVRLGDPEHVAGLNLGAALEAKRDYDGAITVYREVIRLAPRIASAHFNLGNALAGKGEYAAAAAAYGEAVALDPKHDGARKNLVLARKRQAEQAERTAPAPREVKR